MTNVGRTQNLNVAQEGAEGIQVVRKTEGLCESLCAIRCNRQGKNADRGRTARVVLSGL